MKTLANRIVMMAASALLLGTMAFGQTEMKAKIPFAFRAGNVTLPAGEYAVGHYETYSAAALPTLRNVATSHSIYVIGGSTSSPEAANPSLRFRCTDDGGCVLAGLTTSRGAVTFRNAYKSDREKEAAFIVIPLRAVNAD